MILPGAKSSRVENVDAIRALMGIEGDWKTSVQKTDDAIATYNGL